jgi:hypothetical protein
MQDPMLESTTHPEDREPSSVEEGPDEPRLRRLSRLQFWGIFAFAVAMFLFSTGPVWRNAWNMSVLNTAILWSYLPLPFLVAGALAYRRALGFKAFFLDVLELTLLKYSTTFGIALVLWSVYPPPAEPVASATPHAEAKPAAPPPKPTVLDPARLGTLKGTVSDASGPVAGALVSVSGLEDIVFAPPAAPLVLVNDGSGITPRLAGAMVGQKIEARSSDGRLHTLVATANKAAVFNVPLLPAGVARTLEVAEPHGLMELRCTVHPGEPHTFVGVFANPFFALTDADGRFSFEGVPAGALKVSVSRDGHAKDATADVTVEGRATAETKLQL